MKVSMWVGVITLLLSGMTNAASYSTKMSVDQALIFYCGNNKVEFEQTVTVGQGTRISHHQGAFYHIEQAIEEEPEIAYLSQHMVSAGLSKKCSEYLISTAQKKTSGPLARVYFQFNQHSLTDKSKYVLRIIKERLASEQGNYVLEGHTDSKGKAEYNFALALKRSTQVESYLKEIGVDGQQLTATSKGETVPLKSNGTEKGRASNRRVDIKTQ
ncbi:MAG: OmpA family protein [Aliivibrio sp.]|uniref:OmpA family protein n=1 Tax=Aliivibrio sp. TaxID=1872443 RepID=UPI001A3FA354|nr:OmpA family protein [Aliivibrio sp.]